MKPVILACFLLSSLLSPAQEAPPITLQEEVSPAPVPDKTTSLAAPYLLDRIPDGTPPPPAKPKPPFLLPPAAARGSTVYQEGGRSISISRIDPIALPPPPVPDAPLTEEQLAAWQAAKDAYAARIKHETFLFLGATVYLPENLPPRSYVTVWGNGRKPVSFWSNADFRLLAGLGRFARGDGSTCRIMMTWSPMRPELVRNRKLSSRIPWKMPEIPAFPDESDHSARFLPKDPLAFQELDKNISGAIEDLHVLYNREHPRLLAAWQGRERARLAREEKLKANPPKPKDIIIHHFDLGESRPVAPAPQPAAPGALPPVRQRRSRRDRTGRSQGSPSSGDRTILLSCLLAISSLAVIPAATSMIDANNNQVSDIYERAWNNGELLPPGHAPESDVDGDGWSLAREAAAGTDPLTGGAPPSYLQVFVEHVPPVYGDLDEDGIEEVISPETQLLGWPTVSGKVYQLEVSPSMAGDSWMPLGAPRVGTGADMGSGVPITQSDGSTPDRMFFRVAVTDIDEDGDGLESAEEALLGTDPFKRDSDADGLNDQEEALAGSNPNDIDTDNDGKSDSRDADPREKLVDWDITPEPSYVLIDIETPEGNESSASDLNDKGEVLFDDGIWAAGEWIPKPMPEVTGLCQLNGEETSYTSQALLWSRFNDTRHLLGQSEITFTSGQAAGGDGLFSSMTQSAGETPGPSDMSLFVTPFFDPMTISLDPLGVTESGAFVSIFTYLQENGSELDERSKLVIYNGVGSPADLLAPPDGSILMGMFTTDAKVTPDGWVVSQFRKETSTATDYGLVMWNPQRQIIDLPPECAGWNHRVNLTKLPNQRAGLVAVRGQNADGLIVMQDDQGVMQQAQTLAQHGIQLMSADGSGITRDDKFWRNGKLKPIRDLCKRYGELLDTGWTFHPLKANSHGRYLLDAEGPGGEKRTKLLLPVEVVQGEPGRESEDVGNWLMAEANPKPEVEMTITNAVVSGSDVVVSVQGSVTDRLSKFGETAAEKVQTLNFIVDGQTLHSINISNGVEDGFDFNETVTIPNAKARGYTLRAETSENLAANKGWDQVAVGLNLVKAPTFFSASGSEFSIVFDQNPTSGTVDSAKVYFGNRAPLANDLTVTETAADSSQFEGQVEVAVGGQVHSVPCTVMIKGANNLANAAADDLYAEISYTHPTLGVNRLYGRWKETASSSLTFSSCGYQGGDETLQVGAMVNLPGSQNEGFEPITLRINGPENWENSNTVKIKVGDTEYPLKKFTFNGKESLYPYDETNADQPKQFLPSAKAVPQKLHTPGYTAGGGSFDFMLKIGTTEHDLQTVQVQRRFRDDFFVTSPPIAAAEAATGPVAIQAQAAQAGWKKPGDKVSMNDLLTAYKWIYGTNENAMTLLRAYRENGNIITLGDELDDLDVNYILRTDNKIEIEIENDDTDVNPVVCANLLHAGLYQALAYPPLNTHPEIADDINLFVASRTAFAQTAAEITSTAAELYLSGISFANEGLDFVLAINEVAEGNYVALAAALPVIPVGAVKIGSKAIRIRSKAGDLIGEITNPLQLDAISKASKKRLYSDKIAIYEAASVPDGIIAMLVRGGELEASKAHKTLKARMVAAGRRKPGKNFEAHHDLPWEFKREFAEAKIDVNENQYGRWVHEVDHNSWHHHDPKFNDMWYEFFYQNIDGEIVQVARTKAEILAKLAEVRANYIQTITE